MPRSGGNRPNFTAFPRLLSPCVFCAAAVLPEILYSLPDAAIKNDHKCSGLTPHSPGLLRFWRSESNMDLWVVGFQRLWRELAFCWGVLEKATGPLPEPLPSKPSVSAPLPSRLPAPPSFKDS